MVCWPSGFWDAWGAKAQKKTCSGKCWLFGLAALGGKAKNQTCLEKVWFVAWYPRPPKNHLPQKHFGIPLNHRHKKFGLEPKTRPEMEAPDSRPPESPISINQRTECSMLRNCADGRKRGPHGSTATGEPDTN